MRPSIQPPSRWLRHVTNPCRVGFLSTAPLSTRVIPDGTLPTPRSTASRRIRSSRTRSRSSARWTGDPFTQVSPRLILTRIFSRHSSRSRSRRSPVNGRACVKRVYDRRSLPRLRALTPPAPLPSNLQFNTATIPGKSMIGLKRRFNLLQVRARAFPLPRALPRATMARREKESAGGGGARAKSHFPRSSRVVARRVLPRTPRADATPSLRSSPTSPSTNRRMSKTSNPGAFPCRTTRTIPLARLRPRPRRRLPPRPRARSRPRRPPRRPPTRSDERVSPGRRRNTVCFSSAWPSLERVTGAASLETLSSRGRPRRLLRTRRSTSSDSTRSTRKISAAAPSTTSRP